MIDKRIGQLETDVRMLMSLVARLETEAQAQNTKMRHLQGAIDGLAKDVADLRQTGEQLQRQQLREIKDRLDAIRMS